MKSTPLHFFIVVALAFFSCSLAAQNLPDIVVFDRGDSIGAPGGYYDSSVGLISGPSTMTVSGPGHDKMIVLNDHFYTGQQGGLIQWKSAPGGNWTLFVASPGFTTRNVSGYSFIIFYVNGPSVIAATNLPRVALESSSNQKTSLVQMNDYLPEGLDDDTNTWQLVGIPLADFQPYNGFALSQFKDVNFNQGRADNATNTLWLDGVRVVSSTNVPGAPLAVTSLAGDRSVILHWERSAETDVAGYHVYRSQSANGVFSRVTANPLVSPSFADVSVTNGQTYFYFARAINGNGRESVDSSVVSATPRGFASDDEFLEYLQHAAFDYFWYEANPTNGLVRDRSQPNSVSSMAATGFGLTGIGIAIDRGWITRSAGRDRVLATLRTLWEKPQGVASSGTIGYRGWFYHFVDTNTGLRAGNSELSSIDTGLLLAGVLYSREYFNGSDTNEIALRDLATSIFNRVDWTWMRDGQNSLTHGWRPESGFIAYRWVGYNEAMILNLLGLGAATNPLPSAAWENWTSGYQWQTHYGYSFVQFPPLFGHQYSHCWIDFRHIADVYMRGKSSTYFENSRRATLAQREYCAANPQLFGYTTNIWGLTACDGPGSSGFFGYIARGAPPAENDDGTIAPTAVAGSLPFAPEVCLPTLRFFYDNFRVNIWTGYGFRDAFNLQANWWDSDVLGIDQGPILIMLENYRSQRVWKTFAQISEVQRGLIAAGFTSVPFVSPLSLAQATGEITLSWMATNGLSYQVEYSPDLIAWRTSPGSVRATNNGTLHWMDVGPPATLAAPESESERFYRVFILGSSD